MNIQLNFTVILMLALSVAFTSCGGEGAGDAAGNLPVVTTAEIAGNPVFTVNIAGTSAKGGGDVTEQGDSEVTERGVCWNTTGNPTISDSRATDRTGTGEFTNASMSGLAVNTTYYVRAYATNSDGTSYGNEITFNSGRTFGTDYAGGYVFYNDGNGGGLVCAKTNQTSPKWSNVTSTSIGTTGTAIGTGLANSNAIVGQTGHTTSAANECLVYTDGTYSDWFLPSKDELNLMHSKLKLNGYGGFTEYYYWSSSEAGSSAWIQYFDDGGSQNSNSKSSTSLYTRAVRAF